MLSEKVHGAGSRKWQDCINLKGSRGPFFSRHSSSCGPKTSFFLNGSGGSIATCNPQRIPILEEGMLMYTWKTGR